MRSTQLTLYTRYFTTFSLLIPLKGTSFGSALGYYASIFHDKAFFVFGGTDADALSTIGRLDAVTRTWSLAGHLKRARYAHAVVFEGEKFLVIGGFGDFKTENCVLNIDTYP